MDEGKGESGRTIDAAASPERRAENIFVSELRLDVIGGKDTGLSRTSNGERLVIGTHESAQLRLSDPTVSRFHCELAVRGGRVSVRDLESTNGTLVNGVSIVHALLDDGAVLTLGDTKLRSHLGAGKVEIPVSAKQAMGSMVGRSPALRAAFALLENAARTDATVLIEGETGTGKELAAEAVHVASARQGAPFIVVDCGAIPAELLESELFGHEKGAFTGAMAARQGAFEAAGGGTVFLDEIGELDLSLQPKLLRALERHEIKRVGASRYLPVDFRVVAATNRNLRTEVNAGRFRADLYYRLAVVEVRLPPLRERPEDLPVLVESLLEQLGAGADPLAAQLRQPDVLAELARHAWPGNVRELRNYVERSVALRRNVALENPASSLPLGAPATPVDISRPLKVARDAFERAYVEEVMKRHGGNATAAARAAGVDRAQFYRFLWRYGLR
jgi:transcriptional regulator with PAS, ATPase and Fis domain